MIGIAAASGTERNSTPWRRTRCAARASGVDAAQREKVSSICNDVVGDICGIISGATGALIAANLAAGRSGVMTVRDLAACNRHDLRADHRRQGAGKGVAMAFSSKVLALCGRLLSVLPFSFDAKKNKSLRVGRTGINETIRDIGQYHQPRRSARAVIRFAERAVRVAAGVHCGFRVAHGRASGIQPGVVELAVALEREFDSSRDGLSMMSGTRATCTRSSPAA